MKDYEAARRLNYLLPVQIGAPDYYNYLNKFIPFFLSTIPVGLICLTDSRRGYHKINKNFLSLLLYSKNKGLIEWYRSKGCTLFHSLNKNSNKGYAVESLGPYLAGLFEGDGHVVLSKSVKKEFKVITNSLLKFINIESFKENKGLFIACTAGKILKNSYKNKPETVKAKGIFLVY